MSYLRLCVFICVCLCTVQIAQAQNSQFQSGFTAKKLFLDYQSLNGGEFGAFNRLDNGVELGYTRNLANNLNLYLPVKIGTITLQDADTEIFMLGVDLQAQYYFLKGERTINPYAIAGFGVAHEEGNQVEDIDPIDEKVNGQNNVQFPLGIGMDVGFHPRGFFNLQATYRPSTEEDRSNFNFALGWKYLFGPRDPEEIPEEDEMDEEDEKLLADSDKDGIIDELDLCPQTPGLAEFKGCPDTDGDGVMDPTDDCPEVAGPKSLNGCPDSDGDGIADSKDECPSLFGTIANNGCPEDNIENIDRDGDGINNDIDECPDEAGPLSNRGCPEVKMEDKDRDGDGISNDIDECPDQAGPLSNRGCPEKPKVIDSDGDGLRDEDDRCPNVYGPPSNGGCPIEKEKDTDGDGIPDSRDLCPDLLGVASGQGCPDSDGDGVNDILDECPSIPGLRTLDGCPDNDGDGVANKFDDCPESFGPKSNNGCPEIKAEDRRVLDRAMKSVQFSSASDNLRAESYAILDQVADVLRSYPEYNLEIAGHTDNVGDSGYNQRLSRNRARSCYEYLISRGVAKENMTYVGYGESRPIANNDTPEGRALNRRTAFNLYPRSGRR